MIPVRKNQSWINILCAISLALGGGACRERKTPPGSLTNSQTLALADEPLPNLPAGLTIRLTPRPERAQVDRERVQVALAALLSHTAAGKVDRVVLDLTGAVAVDAVAAGELLRVIRVLQLQGVAPVLSGIGPALAQAIVGVGLDIAGVPCFLSIEAALAVG